MNAKLKGAGRRRGVVRGAYLKIAILVKTPPHEYMGVGHGSFLFCIYGWYRKPRVCMPADDIRIQVSFHLGFEPLKDPIFPEN